MEEAEEIVQAQKEKAEAERQSSLTGLENEIVYDEYGQPIVIDEAYKKELARQRWHWAFTKIVQVRTFFLDYLET